MELRKTIYVALGSNKFRVMTGAKNFVYDDTSLTFQIPRLGYCTVKYDEAQDLFNMTFFKIRKFERKINKEFKGLFVDQLREFFEDFTGLRTSL